MISDDDIGTDEPFSGYPKVALCCVGAFDSAAATGVAADSPPYECVELEINLLKFARASLHRPVGDIGELIVFDIALSDEDCKNLTKVLMDEYSLSSPNN